MKSFTITAVAGLAAVANAVEFTNSNFDITPGQDFELTWANAEGDVTIRLRRGDPDDLDTIEDITTGETGDSFTWSVPSDLPDGDDYALEISDGSAGPDAVNYSPQFPLGGGGDTVTTESAVPTTETIVSVSSASSETQIVISESVSSVPVTTEIPTSEIHTSEPISSEVHTSEVETSSVVVPTSSLTTSASGSETAATGTETGSSPTGTSDGSDDDDTQVPDSKAGHFGSPVALICFTVAAMLYFQ